MSQGKGKGRRKPPPTRRSGNAGRPRKQTRGRTGAVDGRPKKPSREGLGGDQIEGIHAVREALLAGRRKVYEILLSTDRADAPDLEDIRILAEQYSVPVRELGRAKLGAEARTSAHQGVIARAAGLRETDIEELFERNDGAEPFLLACDGITDPGNLGALLRTAECAGVTGVLLPRHRAVHVTPAVTRRLPARSNTSGSRSSVGCRRRWPTRPSAARWSSVSTWAAMSPSMNFLRSTAPWSWSSGPKVADSDDWPGSVARSWRRSRWPDRSSR